MYSITVNSQYMVTFVVLQSTLNDAYLSMMYYSQLSSNVLQWTLNIYGDSWCTTVDSQYMVTLDICTTVNSEYMVTIDVCTTVISGYSSKYFSDHQLRPINLCKMLLT